MKPANPAPVLPRFRDATGAQLSAGLDELAARGPDAAELASLATRLSLLGLPMTLPAPSQAANPAGNGLKLGLVGGAALAGGVALWLSLQGSRSAVPPERATTPASIVSVADEIARTPASNARSAPSAQRREHQTSDLAESASPLTPPPSVAEQAPAAADASLGSPQLRLEAAAVEPEDALERATSRSAKPPKPGAKAAPQAVDAQSPALPDASQPSELEILRGARLAVKSSPSEALRLTAQHQTSYPAGKLTQERELIAISALVGLGRRTAALARAGSFERSFPNSPYRKQISELLQ